MVSRDNGDRWWEGPATLGQVLIGFGGIVLTILIFIVTDRISGESRMTALESQARVNAHGIEMLRESIADEARSRVAFDGQVGAKLDAISERLATISTAVEVIKAQHAPGIK